VNPKNSSRPSSHCIAVVNCGELVTLAGPGHPRTGEELQELSILNDGAMLIADGRIASVGTYAEIKPLIPRDTTIIDAGSRVVTPGFVDAHTHLVFAGNRLNEFEQRIAGETYQEIAAAGGGITATITKTREATHQQLVEAASAYADWFLRGGTTTIEAKSGYGLTKESELKILEVIQTMQEQTPLKLVPTFLGAHTIPPEFRDRREEYLRILTEELIPEVAKRSLAQYCDAFCDEHALRVSETRCVFEAAKQHGLGLRIHAEQFSADGGASLAAELGAQTADHLECTEQSGISALQTASVQPVLLPASVFALGRNEYPKARWMIEAGLSPVIATDFNPGSSPTTSMYFILSLACLYLRMLPSEALTAATINAAWSLGLGDSVGSLETGKGADFLIHEFRDYREMAYFLSAPAYPRVFVAGEEITGECQ
jgi:imidazolonepropionase